MFVSPTLNVGASLQESGRAVPAVGVLLKRVSEGSHDLPHLPLWINWTDVAWHLVVRTHGGTSVLLLASARVPLRFWARVPDRRRRLQMGRSHSCCRSSFNSYV